MGGVTGSGWLPEAGNQAGSVFGVGAVGFAEGGQERLLLDPYPDHQPDGGEEGEGEDRQPAAEGESEADKGEQRGGVGAPGGMAR